jgi:hypothetical protein
MFKLFFSLVFCAFFIFSSTSIFAQEGDAQSEQMKLWMEYMTPGTMHEMLAKSVGDWKTINKFWMDPAGEPMVSEGTAKIEMILGGRYQTSKHNGLVMGMPMEGMSLMGYDNATQEFTAIWIDNMGTGTSVAKGKYDESTKTLTMDGAMVDPMTKEEMKFKQIMKIIDDNHHMFEMYMNYNGQEFKSMEVEFVRK